MNETNKNIYITMLGRSVWAVLNAYYAVLKENKYLPDEIMVYAEGKLDDHLQQNIDKVIEGLKLVSEHFEISPIIKYEIISQTECNIDTQDDFVKAVISVSTFIKTNKQKSNTIALDITPGKKTLVAGSLLPISLNDIDHLFYLSIKKIQSNPFMMIPLHMQQLYDFKEQVMEVYG